MAHRFPHPLLTSLLPAALAPVAVIEWAAADPGVYEVENGVLTGVFAAPGTPGYSGSGYVAGFDDGTDQVAVTVAGGGGGLHDLAVVYRSSFGDKRTRLLLNGVPAGDLLLPGSDIVASVPARRVLLRTGDNTVALQSNWGWYEIDALCLTPTLAPPPHRTGPGLVNPNATAEARSLMTPLADNYGRTMLSGQQDIASLRWLEANVGKASAIAGLDLMDYSPSRVKRGTTSAAVDEALKWDARGGITTLTWHWSTPSGLIAQPGRESLRGFYTEPATMDLAAAITDPTGGDYQLLLRDVDAIAIQLQRLQSARMPVLRRSLHEAEGGWFWRGAEGAGPTKQLWRLMYDRLTNRHRVNNLIWVWNSVGADWYSGDDVVDMLSFGSYPQAGDHGPVSATYDRLRDLGRDRKVVGLGEVGSIPDPDLTGYHADWSFFVTWGGGFRTDGQSDSPRFVRRVCTHLRVITLDELGDFKHWSPRPVHPDDRRPLRRHGRQQLRQRHCGHRVEVHRRRPGLARTRRRHAAHAGQVPRHHVDRFNRLGHQAWHAGQPASFAAEPPALTVVRVIHPTLLELA